MRKYGINNQTWHKILVCYALQFFSLQQHFLIILSAQNILNVCFLFFGELWSQRSEKWAVSAETEKPWQLAAPEASDACLTIQFSHKNEFTLNIQIEIA